MTKITFYFCIFYFISLSVKAQEPDSTKINSPFSEPRYHYFLKTILLSNEYLDTDNGSYNTTLLRLLYPIGNKAWNLRFDLPLISANTNSINKSGIGDVTAGISYIPYLKHSNGVALRARVISNSAQDPNFGSGKWVFSPAVFYGRYLKSKKYLWISSAEYQISFAGHSNRNDISTAAFENVILYFFGRNWVSADAAFRYNNIAKGFQNNAFVEYGRKISADDLIYIHPSYAFGGMKTYNFGLEVGILILF
ncbi:lipid A phosphoethanolamine transferase [Flavobacterium gelatinilyticum]|uniref:lipid A phosphoethanolamine transferase n=1 Tax=Flavobacterium gelatinilyticum TaxID=3003260 RepID=UPI0024807448|nr:lipid A phosphoethanolamine transferase [Flavobacterium gelatinilyticum]